MLNERKVMINENENENQVEETTADTPINELFGMTVEEWNRSQEAWDVQHDMNGLKGTRGLAGRAW